MSKLNILNLETNTHHIMKINYGMIFDNPLIFNNSSDQEYYGMIFNNLIMSFIII
jgi:hypothetical protein